MRTSGRTGRRVRIVVLAIAAAAIALHGGTIGAQSQSSLSFFITSVGTGDGANLGGLAGADAHCQKLAAAVGAGHRTWRAYLSGTEDGKPVNARDRIGRGPWFNAKGVQVAASVDDLHSDNNKLGKETSLTEKGEVVPGRGDTPNKHDILTGSQPDGTAFTDGQDHTCNNWTSNGEGTAQVGHHDKTGGGPRPNSWNSAHGTRGCSQQALESTGGAGLFYCFAVD
ncbi:MAG TPA: hypothetical protein VIL25_10160 [Vicinamibacterales bacterium]